MIDVTSADLECQAVFGQLLQIVHGTGSCTQPATPETGNPGAPVMIRDFQFEHWL
jgi:hypothetical protein